MNAHKKGALPGALSNTTRSNSNTIFGKSCNNAREGVIKHGSRKNAIDRFCRLCIADTTQPGSWRTQVEACTSRKCPLYNFRPVSYGSPTASTHEERSLILVSDLGVFHRKSDGVGGAL